MLKGFNVWRKKQFVRLAAGMVACACGISLMGAALQAERGKTPAATGLAVPETAGVLQIRLLRIQGMIIMLS